MPATAHACARRAAARCGHVARRAFDFSEPIDAAGIGVYAVWASVIGTLLFVLLAWQAVLLSRTIDARLNAAALPMLAETDPLALCINVSRAFSGAVGDGGPRLACFGGGRYLGASMGGNWSRATNLSHVAEAVRALQKCGALAGYYCREHLAPVTVARAARDPHALAIVRNLPDLAGDLLWDVLPYTAEKAAMLKPWQKMQQQQEHSVQSRYYLRGIGMEEALRRTWNSSDAPGAIAARVAAGDAAFAFPTWQIVNSPHSVWLSLRQTPETAACLAGRALELDPNANCNSSTDSVVLMPPEQLADYTCRDGVDDTRREQFQVHKATLKERLDTNETFLGVRGLGYDDVMAIYTGALAAVFGGAITLASTMLVILLVGLRRCCCGDAAADRKSVV